MFFNQISVDASFPWGSRPTFKDFSCMCTIIPPCSHEFPPVSNINLSISLEHLFPSLLLLLFAFHQNPACVDMALIFPH